MRKPTFIEELKLRFEIWRDLNPYDYEILTMVIPSLLAAIPVIALSYIFPEVWTWVAGTGAIVAAVGLPYMAWISRRNREDIVNKKGK